MNSMQTKDDRELKRFEEQIVDKTGRSVKMACRACRAGKSREEVALKGKKGLGRFLGLCL